MSGKEDAYQGERGSRAVDPAAGRGGVLDREGESSRWNDSRQAPPAEERLTFTPQSAEWFRPAGQSVVRASFFDQPDAIKTLRDYLDALPEGATMRVNGTLEFFYPKG